MKRLRREQARTLAHGPQFTISRGRERAQQFAHSVAKGGTLGYHDVPKPQHNPQFMDKVMNFTGEAIGFGTAFMGGAGLLRAGGMTSFRAGVTADLALGAAMKAEDAKERAFNTALGPLTSLGICRSRSCSKRTLGHECYASDMEYAEHQCKDLRNLSAGKRVLRITGSRSNVRRSRTLC